MYLCDPNQLYDQARTRIVWTISEGGSGGEGEGNSFLNRVAGINIFLGLGNYDFSSFLKQTFEVFSHLPCELHLYGSSGMRDLDGPSQEDSLVICKRRLLGYEI